MDRTSYTPEQNEKELITILMEIMKKGGYSPSELPPIFVSSETPPIFKEYPELEENHGGIPQDKISIEELLGVYLSRPEEIVIYERGIRWLGHSFEEEQLFSVVLIHEIAHWITHKLEHPESSTWETSLYDSAERDVHEGWAQLMTWWVANRVGGKFKQTFEKLNKKQSPPYQVFERFKSVPINRVIASLGKLRCFSSGARLQDWEEVIGYAEWMAFTVWNYFLRKMFDAGITMEEIHGFQEVGDFVNTKCVNMEWEKFAEWSECVLCALNYGFSAKNLQDNPAFTSPLIKEGLFK